MNAQSVITRLHINRNTQVFLPTKKGQQLQRFIFALRNLQMCIDRTQVNYVPESARWLGLQPTGRNPRCRLFYLAHCSLLQHLREQYAFPIFYLFGWPGGVVITEWRWLVMERERDSFVDPWKDQRRGPGLGPKIAVVAHHRLEATRPPSADGRVLKVRTPFWRMISKRILSCLHNSQLIFVRSPPLGLLQNHFGTHALCNCQDTQLLQALARVYHT